jgi:GT2 family glycosyltransferase/2-polyprenyl-3-methyl-5-hydroxy-6-metoxy-1,4-benzoquinol methylase/tetratricopeptide (TPR) repeat protein
MSRVALLFDNTQRPETTGVYCRRALEELTRSGRIAGIEHILPSDLARLQAEKNRWDLIIAVDDGLDYDLPADTAPVVWWAIDTHLEFERSLRRARQARWTFAAQKNGTEKLCQAGIDAIWLPLACDPELHGRQEVSNEFDLCFVGNIFAGERERLIHLLQDRFPRSFVGQRYFKEMAKTYSSSHMVFNRSLIDDVNMRVFEGLCSGSLLITNDLSENGLDELFQDGVHLATYRSDEELFSKVTRYLKHHGVREAIAATGREQVLAAHTYRHRMEQILEHVEKTIGQSGHENQPATRLPIKDTSYFEFDRPDVLALVPVTAKKVLDVGCGAGRLGASLKSRQAAHVSGVELNPRAAAIAEALIDDVRIVNLETDTVDFADGQFDCVICADILEHLRQPEVVLKKIRQWLSPSGSLVVSVPNVRNHTVIHSLLAGNWTYESAGLLDADHVRFFTRRELEKLLFRAGFEIEELRVVPGEGFSDWEAQGRPREISLGGFQIRAASSDEAAEFFAYQYLVKTVPRYRRSAAAVHPRRDTTDGLKQLAERFSWPKKRPAVSAPQEHLGWFADGARELLQREVTSQTRLVLELGSWLGMSTRFLADRAPQATIIAIDHWKGSPEHQRKPEWQAMLPQLYDTFLSLSWEYRDRIQPLRMSTNDGMDAVAAAGLDPDLIFIDADHTYAAVKEDLEHGHRLFPNATLVGDDYDDPEVQQAVNEAARTWKMSIETFGKNWRAWKLEKPKAHAVLVVEDDSLFGMTSIILVTFNELPYTKICLDSLRLRTDEPYELIVVDNGSTDGTVDYLRAQSDIRLIENKENRGFPAAVNQGLSVAKGEQLLLLNNDTILTTGWLRRMLDVLDSDPQIGLVGPTSNNVGSEQQIPVDYRHLNDLDGFAWTRHAQLVAANEPLIQETDRLIGFCLLFRRSVLDAVGLLDERFGIGCFEDDDFCRRARAAGFSAMIAKSSFIHHFGSVTFQASGADLRKILRDNQKLYQDKWGDAGGLPQAANSGETCVSVKTPPKPRSEFVLTQDEDGNLLIQPNTVRLSGCLIVRNNESTIRPCLESLRPWVDEMIVVDTGSTDATPRIAEELGANVFHWPWRDDFAAARNVSLDHASGEWLFWMDSDDTLPENCGRKLRALVDGEHQPGILGYVMQVHCPGDDPTDVTIVDHVKLFRNLPEIRFEFRIHEQVLPAIRRINGDVEFTDIYVVHSGSDRTKDGQAKKLERDFRLLHLESQDRPDHPFVLFNLGMTHADCGQHEDAIRSLKRCIEVSGIDESHVRKAYALLISSLMQSRRLEEAEQCCREGCDAYPDDKELLFRQAMLEHQLGRSEKSIATYRKVLSQPVTRHFASIDAGLDGFKARHNLALVYEDIRDFQSAAKEWGQITKEQSNYVPAHRGLVDAWFQLGRISELEEKRSWFRKQSDKSLFNLASYCEGRIAELRGDLDGALIAFDLADRSAPEETSALRQICRLLFESGRWSQARTQLERLSERVEEDAGTFCNLGVVYSQVGEPDRAVAAFRRSLELRPESRETWAQLGQLLKQSGRDSEAAECWRHVQNASPPASRIGSA